MAAPKKESEKKMTFVERVTSAPSSKIEAKKQLARTLKRERAQHKAVITEQHQRLMRLKDQLSMVLNGTHPVLKRVERANAREAIHLYKLGVKGAADAYGETLRQVQAELQAKCQRAIKEQERIIRKLISVGKLLIDEAQTTLASVPDDEGDFSIHIQYCLRLSEVRLNLKRKLAAAKEEILGHTDLDGDARKAEERLFGEMVPGGRPGEVKAADDDVLKTAGKLLPGMALEMAALRTEVRRLRVTTQRQSEELTMSRYRVLGDGEARLALSEREVRARKKRSKKANRKVGAKAGNPAGYSTAASDTSNGTSGDEMPGTLKASRKASRGRKTPKTTRRPTSKSRPRSAAARRRRAVPPRPKTGGSRRTGKAGEHNYTRGASLRSLDSTPSTTRRLASTSGRRSGARPRPSSSKRSHVVDPRRVVYRPGWSPPTGSESSPGFQPGEPIRAEKAAAGSGARGVRARQRRPVSAIDVKRRDPPRHGTVEEVEHLMRDDTDGGKPKRGRHRKRPQSAHPAVGGRLAHSRTSPAGHASPPLRGGGTQRQSSSPTSTPRPSVRTRDRRRGSPDRHRGPSSPGFAVEQRVVQDVGTTHLRENPPSRPWRTPPGNGGFDSPDSRLRSSVSVGSEASSGEEDTRRSRWASAQSSPPSPP